MKHTPGPWTIDDGDTEAYGVFASDQNAICYLSANANAGDGLRGESTDRANANLIAAAPDMLEALEEIKRSLVMVGGITGTAMSHGEQIDLGLLSSELGRIFTVATNAIDKAKGEGA